MAYSLDGFYPDTRAAGLRIHSYTTTDTIATVNTAGYFNSLADILNVNDVIIVASSTGGTPVLTIAYVNSNDGSTVDVVDGLTITATDSD